MSAKKKEEVCNQTALRDACLACIKRIDETLPYTDSGMVLTGLCNHIKATLKNALKDTQRNCDRFNSGYKQNDEQDALESILDEGCAGYISKISIESGMTIKDFLIEQDEI